MGRRHNVANTPGVTIILAFVLLDQGASDLVVLKPEIHRFDEALKT
jgi:hypothetical protein